MNPVIELKDVHVLYGKTLALDVEHLAIAGGERVFLLGHSGSGKTTLSRLVKGRLRPSTGTVRVLGGNPAARQREERQRLQRQVAMIDQESHLIPRLPVSINVMAGSLGRVPLWRSLLGSFPRVEWERVERILGEVDLDGLGGRRVETLSGGQRQRTAIARALMQASEIVLADEPVSSLDPELAEDALELLVEGVARRGVTLLVNLHQPEVARRFATRFVGLLDGRVVYDGPPEGFTQEHAELVYRSRRDGPKRSANDVDDPPTVEPPSADAGLRLVRR